MFSEQDLALTPRWFTGQDWADGTAERFLVAEYYDAVKKQRAIEDAKTPEQKAADKRAQEKKRFLKWFAWKAGQDGE